MDDTQSRESHKLEDNKPNRELLSVAGEIIGLILATIFLYRIFPDLSFITSDYRRWLPIGFWSAVVGAFFNILKRLTHLHQSKKVLEASSNAVALYSTYMLIRIYPFDLENAGYGQYDQLLRLVLWAVILALSIALVVNTVSIFTPQRNNQRS